MLLGINQEHDIDLRKMRAREVDVGIFEIM